MMSRMRRINVYLTAAQSEFLEARATATGTTRSAVLRDLIDAAAARPITLDTEIRRALAELAYDYGEISSRLFEDDPDLSINPVEAETR